MIPDCHMLTIALIRLFNVRTQ